MQHTIKETTGLSDQQLIELLRYALALKASYGLATREDFQLLKELLFYREPSPRVRRTEAILTT